MFGHIFFLGSNLILKKLPVFKFLPDSYPKSLKSLYVASDVLHLITTIFTFVKIRNLDTNSSLSIQILAISIGFLGSALCFRKNYDIFLEQNLAKIIN